MKIQPIDFHAPPVMTPMNTRPRPIFDRQFTKIMVKIPSAMTPVKSEGYIGNSEASSAHLSLMVQNFFDEFSVDQRQFSSVAWSEYLEDDLDHIAVKFVESCEPFENLILCTSVPERNLLAEIERIVEKNNKICKRRDGIFRKAVNDGLLEIGYDASLCKSRWEKSPSFPAPGEYEYIDVIVEGERMIVDVDFRSQFEIACPTKAYRKIVQALPRVFVGKSERLQGIVSVVSDAAKQSLNKKGMPVPPWRKHDYVASKWLSPHSRVPATRELEPSRAVSGSGDFEFGIASVGAKGKGVKRKQYGFKVKKIVASDLDGVPLKF